MCDGEIKEGIKSLQEWAIRMESDQAELRTIVEENSAVMRDAAGLFKAYHDGRAIVRFLTGLQVFSLWLVKWGVIGGAAAWVVSKLAEWVRHIIG